MVARHVIKNFNLIVDGKGHAGQIEEFNPPKLTRKTEEFRAGGMDAPIEIDMGMEKLEADFSLISFDRDMLRLYGVGKNKYVSFVGKGVLESYDGTVTPVSITMRGKIKEMDMGGWKSGDKASLKISMALVYYKLEHGTEVVQEVDIINMVHVVDGVDQLAEQRAALGM